MPKQPLNTLIAWFKTGFKPLEIHFRDWLQSFWHKDEKIPISSIAQLPETLNDLSQNGLPTVWENISGPISGNEDLSDALAGKADLGEDGKVLPEQLPDGLGGGGSWGDIDGDIQTQADLMTRLNKKADLDPEGRLYAIQLPITTAKADLGEDGKVPLSQLPTKSIIELEVGDGLTEGQTELNIPGSAGRKIVVFRSDIYQSYKSERVKHIGEDLIFSPAIGAADSLLLIII